MAKFKDTMGREWDVAIDVWMLEQITERATVDLDNLLDEKAKGLVALFKSTPAVVRTLWVCIDEQAQKRGISQEQFKRSMAGDRLEDARLALYEAIADFYPPQSRELLMTLGKEFMAAMRIDYAIHASSSSATGSPELQEPIPAAAG